MQVIVTTSWDDGHVLDKKLANLLRVYRIAGTFYISPKNAEFKPQDLLTAEDITELASQFEIGAHTMTHPHLTKVSKSQARQEIVESKKVLEDMLGKEVHSFCYPAGYVNPAVEQMVQEAGFTLARTVVRGKTLVGNNPFRLPTSVHAYQHASDLWRSWDDAAIRLFNKVEAEGGVYHLWGHSWEIEARGDWHKLERVLAHIARRPNVSYVTNGALV